ncbi:MAG: hypothetical protein OEM67_05560 [Thermoleophilia bacterium]|nr:hypothetical protein [Thermoleophilia bacterium]
MADEPRNGVMVERFQGLGAKIREQPEIGRHLPCRDHLDRRLPLAGTGARRTSDEL